MNKIESHGLKIEPKKNILAEIAWIFSYAIKPKIKGADNLDLVINYLKAKGPVFFAFNHVNNLDLFVMLELLRKLEKHTSQFVVGAALKISEGREKIFGQNLAGPIIEGLSAKKQIIIANLLQTHDAVGREMHSNPNEINTRGLATIAQVLLTESGVGLLSPGGHRTGGELDRSKSGINRIFKDHPKTQDNTLLVPIGLEYNKGLRKNKLHVGNPLFYRQVIFNITNLLELGIQLDPKTFLGDYLSIAIGAMLPPQYHGAYKEEIAIYQQLNLPQSLLHEQNPKLC